MRASMEYRLAMPRDELEFRVLGPVEVLRGGRPVAIGGRRQRALLALLLLDVDRPVAPDRLIDELWRDRAPSGASTLPASVSRLRTALGGGRIVEATPAGYALHVSGSQVDARRFERLVEEGRTALADGRARRALDRLRAGLSMWASRPFGDVADEGALRDEAERLEELHLLALESRIEAEQLLAPGDGLVPELETLVHDHPFRERFWEQLMLALYRSGRQADALVAYQRARTSLADELGLDPGERLEELQRAILRHEVPTVRAVPTEHDLPAPLTSFVGRVAELAEIESLLDRARLVTLTGPGGVGKSRLAVEAAQRAVPDLPDGAGFVDLANSARGSPVARVSAQALGFGEHADATAMEVLVRHLRDSRMLLVLDDCEHVREAVAGLAGGLLQACRGLRILATSREALGVPGEVDYPVAPLALPRPGAGGDEVLASDAVQLFVARVLEHRPSLAVDEATVEAAVRICGDLDGLPLAIELAAARAKALSLDEIATRLSDRFRFLVSWRRLAAARHRTLRAAMDWSHELLEPDEQELFARLSVFAGPFTLAAAGQVCAYDEEQALDLLERLVGASLVVAEERAGGMQYRLLETVRQYAASRLTGDAADAVRRAHARYYLDVALGADLSAVRRGSGQRLDVAIAAQENLRRALSWAVEVGAATFGLELATSLERFWVTQDPAEGIRWFGALFARPEASGVDAVLRANALRAYGSSADIAGDDDMARQLYEQSLEIFVELGDEVGQAVLLHRVAIAALRRGDLPRARSLAQASHRIHERLDDHWGQAQTLGTMGAIARDAGDGKEAAERFVASLELARAAGVTWWVSGIQGELANLLLEAGSIGEADARARESLHLADEMGDRAGRVFGVALLARTAAERGRLDEARRLWSAVADVDAVAPLGGWHRHRAAYREWFGRRLGGDGGPSLPMAPALTLDEAVTEALRSRGRGRSAPS